MPVGGAGRAGGGRAEPCGWGRDGGSGGCGQAGAGRVGLVGRAGGAGRSGRCRPDAVRPSMAGVDRAGSDRAERERGARRRHGALGASELYTQLGPGSGGVLVPPDVEGAYRAGAGC